MDTWTVWREDGSETGRKETEGCLVDRRGIGSWFDARRD